MGEAIDQGLILIGCLLFSFTEKNVSISVVSLLIGIIFAAACIRWKDRRAHTALLILFCVLLYPIEGLIFFFPVAGYVLTENQIISGKKISLLWLSVFAAIWPVVRIQPNPAKAVTALLLVAAAARMAVQNVQKQNLIRRLKEIRDSDMELNLTLRDKNRILMESQENEVRMATLQERNRIAREIHDHVGHMLTRSILQMGALQTVYQQEPLHSQLSEVNLTLNHAMNSIRESVHDLHDDSVDLRLSVEKALEQLRDRCHVTLDYDLAQEVPKEVRFCFIATVKEAVSNIIRHSDCSEVHVMLREHPALYQLVVEDNGQNTRICGPDGMGLGNMRDRVEALQGHIRIDTDHGFRIFISVPRKNREE